MVCATTPQYNGTHKKPNSLQAGNSAYRYPEIEALAECISERQDCVVAGLPGVGCSSMLRHVVEESHSLHNYVDESGYACILLPIDLHIIPDPSLASFYSVILRAFYHSRNQFDACLEKQIAKAYKKCVTDRSALRPQNALLEIMADIKKQNSVVVWVLHNFDYFSSIATSEMLFTLRAISEMYADNLCYVLAIERDVSYLSDPSLLGPLYEITDANVLWIQPLNGRDAGDFILQFFAKRSAQPDVATIRHIVHLTGGYPSLLRAVCEWWRKYGEDIDLADFADILLEQKPVQHRLDAIWDSLSQEEQVVVRQIGGKSTYSSNGAKGGQGEINAHKQERVRSNLEMKGICSQSPQGWRLFGDLFVAYVRAKVEGSCGRIWKDMETGACYQGNHCLDTLAPLEYEILSYLLANPHKRLSHTQIIEAAWPDDVLSEGVSTENLYQHVRQLRKQVEPDPGRPVFIVNWRGQPEGGYQFFPEGRPRQL